VISDTEITVIVFPFAFEQVVPQRYVYW